jgi:hypothetical protein
MVVQNGKPFEIQGLGSFGPLVDKFRKYRDPMDKGEEKVMEVPSLKPIRFLAHDDFCRETGLVCDAVSDKMVRRYNRDEKEALLDAFCEEYVTQLSWASVSRSCLTDQ